ncbi:Phage integrase family protein [Tepidibacter thalassicus DSM 15285]|uniref:Phage integrase family protein n=1 Tax=Tepidibacter thalassicus DSM 15285 TaxID=1123350 RepID=A0A1M5QLB2_9FIRM|nr:Phage integrase family protein [Tepidibacter thalassicus DSM 15285]
MKVHSFRHTLGTRLLKEKQVDIVTVSKILRHSSSKVTEDFYINANKEDKLRAINMLDD